MAVQVWFKNPRTGEQKKLKVGFSWTCLFFSGFFGIPLFIRKLNTWGGIMVGYTLLFYLFGFTVPPVAVVLMIVGLGVEIWLGIKANEMAAKNYLALGWEFAEPQGAATAEAIARWGLAQSQQPQYQQPQYQQPQYQQPQQPQPQQPQPQQPQQPQPQQPQQPQPQQPQGTTPGATQ